MSWTSLQALPKLPALAFALAFTVVLALVFTAVLVLVFSVELELVSEIDFLLALFEDPFLETPLEVLGSLRSWAFAVVLDTSSSSRIWAVSKVGVAAKVEAVSKVGTVSIVESVEDVLGSIDKLSLVNLISEKSFEVSLVSVFS